MFSFKSVLSRSAKPKVGDYLLFIKDHMELGGTIEKMDKDYYFIKYDIQIDPWLKKRYKDLIKIPIGSFSIKSYIPKT